MSRESDAPSARPDRRPEPGPHRPDAAPTDERGLAWLWEAGRKLDEPRTSEEVASAVTNAELVAYRRSELSADEAGRVEAALLASTELRERLAALARAERSQPVSSETVSTGSDPGSGTDSGTDSDTILFEAPPVAVREKVLAGFGTAFARPASDFDSGPKTAPRASEPDAPSAPVSSPARGGTTGGTTGGATGGTTGGVTGGTIGGAERFGRRALAPWLAVAAALALAVLVPFWRQAPEPHTPQTQTPRTLPADTAWQLVAEGDARVRGPGLGSGSGSEAQPGAQPRAQPGATDSPRPAPLELRPETLLRLEASPNRSLDGIDFVLFHDRGSGPVRVPLDGATVTVESGAVRIEGETRALLGPLAERGRLLLALGRAGALPTAEQLAGDILPPASERFRIYEIEYRRTGVDDPVDDPVDDTER